MERTGNKKIIKWLGIWLLTGILLLACILLTALHGERVKRNQLAGLLSSHPEMEAELVENFFKSGTAKDNAQIISETLDNKYGFSLWTNILTKQNILSWIGIYAVITIIYLVFLYLHEKKALTLQQENQNRLLWLQETLEQFQKGIFETPGYEPSIAADKQDDAQWERIQNEVTALGAYLDTIVEKLNLEENNTKSLITDLSHQLKTPLASLKISHELAAMEQLGEIEQQEFFKQEEHEIEKLELLLAELVKLSYLETHMIQIHVEASGIKETILDAVNQVYQKAYKKKIELQIEIEQDYQIPHDRKWTVEALVNVLDNAIKYSNEHTNVSLRVQKMSMHLFIEVEDEGIGIAPEEMHKIFQRFYRGREAAGFEKEGAGVGLALARNILEQQGGTISAKRKPEQGTIFRITLPLAEHKTLTKL